MTKTKSITEPNEDLNLSNSKSNRKNEQIRGSPTYTERFKSPDLSY